MKKTKFQILLAIMILLAGCSKDELINNESENNQLKKGRANSITSFAFYGNSVDDDSYFDLSELNDGSKILKNGKISGSIKGVGKINPTLSTYSFESYTTKTNSNSGDNNYTARTPHYILVGKGKVYINSIDYLEFEITEGLYEAGDWAPGYFTPDLYKGGIFICNNAGEGVARVTIASGKFKAFAGRPLLVTRADGFAGIDRNSGKLNLYFQCYLIN